MLRIARAPWLDHGAREEAAELVREYLAQWPAAKTFTTSALMRGMGVPAEAMNGFSRKLAAARSAGMLEGCYEKGRPNAGTFGKPAITWRGEDRVSLEAAKAEVAQRLQMAKEGGA